MPCHEDVRELPAPANGSGASHVSANAWLCRGAGVVLPQEQEKARKRPANGSPAVASKSMTQKLTRAMSRTASSGGNASTAGLWEVRPPVLPPSRGVGDMWQASKKAHSRLESMAGCFATFFSWVCRAHPVSS